MSIKELINLRWRQYRNINFNTYIGNVKITQKFMDVDTNKDLLKRYQSVNLDGHNGLDYYHSDLKIRSWCDSTVLYTGWWEDCNWKEKRSFMNLGIIIITKEKDTNKIWVYGHCASSNVREGQEIKIGDIIGITGKTELKNRVTNMAIHTHIEVSTVNNNNDIQNINNMSWGRDDPLLEIIRIQNMIEENQKLRKEVESFKNAFNNTKSSYMNEIILSEYNNPENIGRLNNFWDTHDGKHLAHEQIHAWRNVDALGSLINEKENIIVDLKKNSVQSLPVVSQPQQIAVSETPEKFSFNKFFIGLAKHGELMALLSFIINLGLGYLTTRYPEHQATFITLITLISGITGIDLIAKNQYNTEKAKETK